MPAMPRPAKAKKISDKILRKPKEKDEKTAPKKGGESEFDKEIRTMIKR